MNDSSNVQRDPLDELLAPPSAVPDEALRRTVLRRTTRVLRRRRRLRTLALAAALAAVYLAGVGTARRTAAPAPTPAPEDVARQREETPPPGPDARPAPSSAVTAEWHAFDSNDRASPLYRQAGDRYLRENGDLESAVRCYRNALDTGDEASLSPAPEDNFLLLAIKDARMKENRHAKNVD
jgi:hypothetical protein